VAKALLEAREEQMATSDEERIRKAVDAAG
jgi:hypothetical protein